MTHKNTKYRTSVKEIKELERKYSKAFDDWKKGDTMVSFLRRSGMNSMADEFEKDYKHLKITL